MAARLALAGATGLLSLCLFGCGDPPCQSVVNDALAGVTNDCSMNGNLTDAECQCTYQTSRLAVYDENAAACNGDNWYPGAKESQMNMRDETCCYYLDQFAAAEYAQATADVTDPNIIALYCREWNEAYINTEAKFTVCALTDRQTSAIANTTAKCAEVADDTTCCPEGRCTTAAGMLV